MRKKVWVALAAGAVVLGATAASMALFSDTTPRQATEYVSGELSISSYRDQGDTIPGPMFYTTAVEGETDNGLPGLLPTGLWAPGDTHMRVLMVRNVGTLDAWLTGVGAELQPGSSRHLADKLQYKVATDRHGSDVLVSGTLGSLVDADQDFAQRIARKAGPAPTPLYFFVSLPRDADNSYQDQTLRVDFTVMAEQMKNNP